MALFKISRGGKAGLVNLEKNDGWAYFTPEDKGFFIDVQSEVNGINYDARIKINERVYTIISSLTAWDTDAKNCVIATEFDSLKGYNCEITLNETALAEVADSQKFAIESELALADISYSIVEETGSIICTCNGTIPTMSIPVIVTIIPAEIQE